MSVHSPKSRAEKQSSLLKSKSMIALSAINHTRAHYDIIAPSKTSYPEQHGRSLRTLVDQRYSPTKEKQTPKMDDLSNGNFPRKSTISKFNEVVKGPNMCADYQQAAIKGAVSPGSSPIQRIKTETPTIGSVQKNTMMLD